LTERETDMNRFVTVALFCGFGVLFCTAVCFLLFRSPNKPAPSDHPAPPVPVISKPTVVAKEVISEKKSSPAHQAEKPRMPVKTPNSVEETPAAEGENFEVSGGVVDEKGKAMPGVRVHAGQDDSSERVQASTDKDGNFGLHLDPGRWLMWATNERWEASEAVEFTAPAKDLRLVVPSEWTTLRKGPYPNNPSYSQRREKMEEFRDALFEAMQNNEGSKFPELASKYGAFLPDMAALEGTPGGSNRAEATARLCYFGYALPDEAAAEAFLDAYEANGPQGIGGEDLRIDPSEVDQVGNSHLYRLRNGIERFFITDINDPYSGQRTMSGIPVCWELPSRGDSGGWVMYLDGHIEWRSYPDEFPLTETLTNRVRGIMASGHRK
jgi:hypothetical protein